MSNFTMSDKMANALVKMLGDKVCYSDGEYELDTALEGFLAARNAALRNTPETRDSPENLALRQAMEARRHSAIPAISAEFTLSEIRRIRDWFDKAFGDETLEFAGPEDAALEARFKLLAKQLHPKVQEAFVEHSAPGRAQVTNMREIRRRMKD